MKIALVAPPLQENTHRTCLVPPLPLSYLAALLEQQRHIVRIYDLALEPQAPHTTTSASLRAFRPHLIVVAAGNQVLDATFEHMLSESHAAILRLPTSLREPAPGHAVAQALWHLHEHADSRDEQSVIFEALIALDDDLDTLPFPARHLLQLEQYPLSTPVGDRQTMVLIAQQLSDSEIILRQPALIVAELHSIVREHGIRHFVFPRPPITHNLEWLRELFQHLTASDIRVRWEASVCYEQLDPQLLQLFHRAGCEVLCFEFTAGEALLSQDRRAMLSAMIRQAHALGIHVRAQIGLEAPYTAIPALVDISATFGLDDAQFHLCQDATGAANHAVGDGLTIDDLTEMARSRYRSSRSRQFFVDRFGPQLGPILWRVGRAGLLGRTWRRYASGEDRVMVYREMIEQKT